MLRLSLSAMPLRPPKLEVGVATFLLKGNKVLMGRRRRTAVASGAFFLPGGHLEYGESIKKCAVREVKEETGLDVRGLQFLTVTNDVVSEPKPVQLITILMRAVMADANQEAVNLEPEKCDGWDWYDWNDLPKPMFGPLEDAVRRGLDPFLYSIN